MEPTPSLQAKDIAEKGDSEFDPRVQCNRGCVLLRPRKGWKFPTERNRSFGWFKILNGRLPFAQNVTAIDQLKHTVGSNRSHQQNSNRAGLKRQTARRVEHNKGSWGGEQRSQGPHRRTNYSPAQIEKPFYLQGEGLVTSPN